MSSTDCHSGVDNPKILRATGNSCSPIPDGRAGLARGPLLYFTLLYFGLLARPEIDFWHFQKPICGLTIIFLFRPEIDFWHFQKPIYGLTINFGISSRN